MKVTEKNSSVLYNGNWYVGYGNSYNIPNTEIKKVNTSWGEKTALINRSKQAIELKSGYNTTANGWCDDLTIKPNQGIFLWTKGSPYSFAKYRVFDIPK
jgi:hypothetical protein